MIDRRPLLYVLPFFCFLIFFLFVLSALFVLSVLAYSSLSSESSSSLATSPLCSSRLSPRRRSPCPNPHPPHHPRRFSRGRQHCRPRPPRAPCRLRHLPCRSLYAPCSRLVVLVLILLLASASSSQCHPRRYCPPHHFVAPPQGHTYMPRGPRGTEIAHDGRWPRSLPPPTQLDPLSLQGAHGRATSRPGQRRS